MPAPDTPLAPAARSLSLRVRLFAGLREAMGWSERVLVAATGATPLAVWRQLELGEGWRRAGGGEGGGLDGLDVLDGMDGLTTAPTAASAQAPVPVPALPRGIRVAINQRFAAADAALADGDELAFLPPISGG